MLGRVIWGGLHAGGSGAFFSKGPVRGLLAPASARAPPVCCFWLHVQARRRRSSTLKLLCFCVFYFLNLAALLENDATVFFILFSQFGGAPRH